MTEEPGRGATSRIMSKRGWLYDHMWLLAALVLGALVRLWDLTGHSLFIDEGFVFHISEHDPKDILTMVAYGDFHPPLFYLATHYLMNALHWPLWDYRYLTASFSLAGIAATWAFARRAFGETAAACAAIAMALDPPLIQWDRMYRMYAILVALTAISWWLLVRADDANNSRRWLPWSAYGLVAVCLPYIHYVGALVVFGQSLYAIVRLRSRWPALVAGFAAAVALIPWLWAIRVQYPNGAMVEQLSSYDFSWLRTVRNLVTYGLPVDWMHSPYFSVFLCIVVGAIALAGVIIGRRTPLPFWFAPVLVQIALSFISGKDLVLPRYLFVYLPALCISIGAVVSFLLQTRYRIVAIGFMLAYGAVSVISIVNLITVPFYQFADWYAVNALLLRGEKQSDIIALVQGDEYWVVRDYTAFRHHDIAAPLTPADLESAIQWLRTHGQQRVWYIENQPDFTDPGRRVDRDLQATRPPLGAWHQPHVFREDVVRIVLYGARLATGGRKSVVKTRSP